MSLKPNRAPAGRFELYSTPTTKQQEAQLSKARPIHTSYGDMSVRQGCFVGLLAVAAAVVAVVLAVAALSALAGLAVNVFRSVTGI